MDMVHADRSMSREDWIDQFCDELLRLRSRIPQRFARTFAALSYNAADDPRQKAREYDESIRPKRGHQPRG